MCIRDRNTADLAPSHHVREVLLLLLLSAELVDRGAAQGTVRGDQHPTGGAGLGDLLDHEDIREDVQAGAAVLLGEEAPQEPHLAHLRDQLVRDLVLLVDADGKRLDLLLYEVADRVPQHVVVLTQREIHVDLPTLSRHFSLTETPLFDRSHTAPQVVPVSYTHLRAHET